MIRATRLPFALAITLAAASCGDLELTSSALAAPAEAPAVQDAPSDPQERLRLLDKLHADLEVAKLQAAIAKARADAKSAETTPGLAGLAAGGPPLPQIGANQMMNLPPLPGSAGGGKGKAKTDSAEGPSVTLVEVWGSGSDRQAVLRSDAGDRLVRVGDETSFGRITAIGAGSVSYRDPKGRLHTLD